MVSLQQRLHREAERLSKELDGAAVVVIVAGSQEAQLDRTYTGWSHIADGREGRLRDLLGILQASIQIETRRHFLPRKPLSTNENVDT